MRLTLRTLLAWLDDTLQPTQVREIGSQVGESPFAQELSERIHRVTRQRRLSVPSGSGAEGVDANVVASYLDNDLDPEAVAEYEKQCLTSDVKLAEVASVHQILSLLGQKVRVPAEAKARMYQLVKGRETVRPRAKSARRPQVPEPVTRPIQPWVDPNPVKHTWIERFGLAAAGIALIGLAVLTASWSLRVSPTESIVAAPTTGELAPDETVASAPSREETHPAPGANPEAPAPTSAETTAEAGQPKGAAGAATESAVASKTKEAAPEKVAKGAETAAHPESKTPTVPPGASGLADASGGVLLRYSADEREWVRLIGSTALGRTDRLLCLSPFRAKLFLGKVPVELVAETEVRVLSQSSDPVPAIELVQGRLLLRNCPTGPLKVGFSDRSVTAELTPSAGVVFERTDRREYGEPVSRVPSLYVYCTQGELALTVGQKQESLTASDVVVIDSAGGVSRMAIDSPPPWASESGPSSLELKLRDQFIRVFHPGRPILTEIVAASEDDNIDIRQLSIRALKSLGDLSLLMPMLSRPGDAVTRRGALAAIRSYMALGPEAANRVRGQLAEEFGDDTAPFVERMLLGYTPQEASDAKLFERLVTALGPEQQSVGVRELALDTLKHLTGRDDLGYDADHPEGRGLSAWKEPQRLGKLRYSPARPKAKASEAPPQ
jgi:hypothetical protein